MREGWYLLADFAGTKTQKRHMAGPSSTHKGSCGLPSSCNEKPEVFDTGNFAQPSKYIQYLGGFPASIWHHISTYFFRKHCLNEGCHCCYVNLYFEDLKMPGILCHKLIISWDSCKENTRDSTWLNHHFFGVLLGGWTSKLSGYTYQPIYGVFLKRGIPKSP
jgi:hypothetical protein